jgi:drug/metabolite transporter (DMT)-like permease
LESDFLALLLPKALGWLFAVAGAAASIYFLSPWGVKGIRQTAGGGARLVVVILGAVVLCGAGAMLGLGSALRNTPLADTGTNLILAGFIILIVANFLD